MEINRDDVIRLIQSCLYFQNLDKVSIHKIVNHSHLISYKKGAYIYKEGAYADGVYIILRGAVRLDTNGNSVCWNLTKGELFGSETGFFQKFRITNAFSVENSIIMKVDIGVLTELLLENSEFCDGISIAFNSLKMACSVKQSWLRVDENIQFFSRQYLLPILIPILLALVPVLLMAFLWLNISGFWEKILNYSTLILGGIWLSWSFFRIFTWFFSYNVVTNQRALYTQRLFLVYDSIQETPIDAILSVTWQTNAISRLFGYGDVIARTYTSSLILKHIYFPKIIAQFLEYQIHVCEMELTLNEKKALANLVKSEIFPDEHHRGRSIPSDHSPNNEEKPKEELNYLPLFFLHATINGIRYYRTHWFFLIKQTILFLSLFIIATSLLFFWNGSLGVVRIVFVLIAFIAFVGMIYRLFDWYNDLFIITKDQVIDIDRKPLGREERRSALIRNIQAIEYKRDGIIGLLLNFGTVFIRVGDAVLTFDNVLDPARVQREISNSVYELKKFDKEKARMENHRLMAESIVIYDKIKQEHNIPPNMTDK